MKLLQQSMRFGAVGLLNTALGLATTYGFTALGAHPVLANGIGYLVGIWFSFTVNRSWTFGGTGARRELPLYLAVIGVAYLLNLVTLLALTTRVDTNVYLAQLVGIAIYTVCCFVGFRCIVFTPRSAS